MTCCVALDCTCLMFLCKDLSLHLLVQHCFLMLCRAELLSHQPPPSTSRFQELLLYVAPEVAFSVLIVGAALSDLPE